MAVFAAAQPLTVAELVSRTGLAVAVLGDPGVRVAAAADPASGGAGSLVFLKDDGASLEEALARTAAQVVALGERLAGGAARPGRTLILCPDPMLFFIRCLEVLFPRAVQSGIDSAARVDARARLAPGVRVEAFALVDGGVSVGAGSIIGSGARLHEGSTLGEGVVVQANAVIGAVGMAYGRGGEGDYVAFPHLGGVRLGDAVDVGPNTTVVRGILTDTEIGPGTKIGNQVNIGHNVTIGARCFISAGATLCGSAQLEEEVWVAPGALVLNHVRVGRGAHIALGAVVTKDVAPGAFVAGMPARAVPR